MPKFSVLMSVYDKEKPEYLDQSLKSIFCQTIMPNEVVICEDGPLTPGLEKIINQYETKYHNIIKCIKFPTNRGLGATLRDGVLTCSNEIIFRMDSDDICVKTRFEKQLDALEKTGADVIGSNIAEYDENLENPTGFRNVPENHNDITKFSKHRNPINHQTVCFRKDKVIKAGNYVYMPFFEDYYLWTRMIQNNCKFYNLQENLVIVRGGSEMIQRRGGKKYMKPIIHFQYSLLTAKYITRFQFASNMFNRLIVALLSPNFRSFFYAKILRTSI